ncbi:glycosyltransferase [Paenibacillus sp. MMS18-CY102]|uniref:glycosyltransferase n=1 Tax=Paenibacillus sp. MMS18-CY102 TaxID=2682849 RepID=UPI001365762D|nr:glycosyltransferase [Paenibacillus sp. MMS18-CY102]MWC29467.1 glycosyltransferase [Paenibacillus sp. MMS18-CY102]
MATSENTRQAPPSSPIRLLIASPIRQSPDILALFLHALLRLRTNGIDVAYRFIDDNDDPRSSKLLQQFAQAAGPAATMLTIPAQSEEAYVRTEYTHQWSESLIWKVASFKNSLLTHAREAQYDYLLLADSDLVLHPDTVHWLVSADRPIVSEIFWTRWQPESAAQPQVWMRDEYVQWEQQRGEKLSNEEQAHRYAAFMNKLRTPGLYEVGGLGALTLISQAALAGNVHFGPISNLSFWGEDRHFCIRAAALGYPLFVDTHCPAFHIYRQADREGAETFLREHAPPSIQQPPAVASFAAMTADLNLRINSATSASTLSSIILQEQRPKLTLSMAVRNESDRYLRQILASHRRYIDEAVIIDDASEDGTAAICLQELEGIPVRLIRNARSRFGNEIELRKQQWAETVASQPEWILCLDADEQFEERFAADVHALLAQQDTDMYCFRLYDLWDASHYREDFYWRAHDTYRPFLLRYRPDFTYEWQETPQHCGRLPINIFQLPNQVSQLRLKHYGWSNPKDRQAKYERYMRLDPDGRYGWREQYESILDAQPRLIQWEE